jgi:ferric-dicitrate binding protein FerR (iron transport regulator)
MSDGDGSRRPLSAVALRNHPPPFAGNGVIPEGTGVQAEDLLAPARHRLSAMRGRPRRWRAGLLVAAALAVLTAALPARAEVAGEVAALRMWAYGTPPDGATRRSLFLADEVFSRELLETVERGALHVRLLDGTMLRLGSATSVAIDDFVYEPAADTVTLLANVGKGVCRFVSGRASKKRLEVTTPAATIAARGTEFSVWIAADGSTTIWVQQGQVEVVPRDGSAPALVNASEIVLAPISGGGIRLDAPRPAPDPGIADTARVQFKRGGKKI